MPCSSKAISSSPRLERADSVKCDWLQEGMTMQLLNAIILTHNQTHR